MKASSTKCGRLCTSNFELGHVVVGLNKFREQAQRVRSYVIRTGFPTLHSVKVINQGREEGSGEIARTTTRRDSGTDKTDRQTNRQYSSERWWGLLPVHSGRQASKNPSVGGGKMAGKTFTSETSSWWVAALAGTGSNLLYSPSGQELYESHKGQGIHRNFDRKRSFPLNNTEGPRQKYPPQAGSVLYLHMYL